MCCVAAATFAICWSTPGRAEPPVDFQRDVRPILAEHCFKCHGPDEGARQADLRLDVRDAAVAALASGATAIAPGKPDDSELLRRIASPDADVIMPPPNQKNPLKPEQIEMLRRWIAEGASYSGHWAFTAPVQPSAPAVEPVESARNAIDNFVVDRLRRDGLALSPSAPHDVLCRRISLDLIGLPPSPREVDEFEAAAKADQPAAVAALVDRLLASEHFGEKWGRHWLDLARYADSNGFEKDLPREQWAWRDWVIRAINADMPFDQFVIEQIAGDMLPDRTQDQMIATGFLCNSMINEEGAIVPEEFRMEAMYDRMDCIGKSILGVSVQCAQCHSHKFDPIAHADYYGLFAFLNNTYEAQSWVYTAEQLEQISGIRSGTAAVEERLKQEHADWQERLAAWEAAEIQQQQQFPWQFVDAIDMHCSSELNHPVQQPDKSILTLGHRTAGDDLYMIAQPPLTGVTGVRLEVLADGDLPFGGPGRSLNGTWALTELVIESQAPGGDKWERLNLANVSADFAEPEHKMEPEWKNTPADKEDSRLCGPAAFLADGKDETGWRADRGLGRRNTDSVAVTQFEKPLELPEGTKLKVTLRTKHGGTDSGHNAMIGRFRVALTTVADPKVTATPYAAARAMQTPAAERTVQQQAEIFAAWRTSVAELKPYNDEIDALWQKFPKASTSILHLAERTPNQARATHRLDRGSWSSPQEIVEPHVPAFLHPLPADAPLTRLSFARWLVDNRSPLAARVQVNRVWQAMFGTGLVETPEDFGTRAPQPEYRNVLDWLAVDTMEHGWSLKRLVRTILASAAYQQSSRATPELLERDPQNRLLARGPRFRAEAEVVRDVALSVSGLLHRKVGGPSIFPPVPQSVLDFNFTKPDYWIPAEGPERYRRAIYIFRKRSMPDPVLTSFDAPNADFACPRRVRSNTPLASLASLNEPVFIEAARALALRVLREGGTSDADRADYAFRLCTGRRATPAELGEVLALLEDRRHRLADGFLSINEVATGDPAKFPAIPESVTPQDAAAWTIAARVLLNLDETLSKN